MEVARAVVYLAVDESGFADRTELMLGSRINRSYKFTADRALRKHLSKYRRSAVMDVTACSCFA